MIIASTVVRLPHGKDGIAELRRLPQSHSPMRFCWFYDGIYRAGFKTSEDALKWAKREGLTN